jgi:diacylglycerol kinase (ATP)
MHRIFAAFQNSRRALIRAWSSEAAVRQELILLALALPLAALIAPGLWTAVALIASLLGVLAVELLNTAIEKLCDQLHPERHDSIGYVKDLGSAAVLMSLLIAGGVWLLALWQWVDHFV